LKTRTEIALKFAVPAASRAAVRAEMAPRLDAVERLSLATLYLDTETRHLAHAGLEWRLRREGRRWIQSLRSASEPGLEWSEHEVIRPRAGFDPVQHAGTAIGARLLAVLQAARQEGIEVGVRSQTEVRRMVRRVRTREAVVEVTVDEGRMLSDQSSRPIRDIEFRRVSGSLSAMLALVERWRKRHGLLYDPRSEAELGEQLAAGARFPSVRKALHPDYTRDAAVGEAFGRVLDECLAHMTRNAVGLYEDDPPSRVEHVHQLRVGIRRLRSALRSFEGWTPAPPPDLVEQLRALFATLGLARDADVLSSGVMAALQKIGAPAAAPAPIEEHATPDPGDTARCGEAQRLLLGWVAWRISLSELSQREANPLPLTTQPTSAAVHATGTLDGRAPDRSAGDADEVRTLRQRAARRLRRWHQRIVADWKAFDELDVVRLHALRKRIKRQRYAVEFFAPLLVRKKVATYLKPLAVVQERMGELNDLFVAQTQYEELVKTEPTAWFALGWLTARIEVVRSLAKPDLGRLAEAMPPA
jgi:CHAD domain-containing protein